MSPWSVWGKRWLWHKWKIYVIQLAETCERKPFCVKWRPMNPSKSRLPFPSITSSVNSWWKHVCGGMRIPWIKCCRIPSWRKKHWTRCMPLLISICLGFMSICVQKQSCWDMITDFRGMKFTRPSVRAICPLQSKTVKRIYNSISEISPLIYMIWQSRQ